MFQDSSSASVAQTLVELPAIVDNLLLLLSEKEKAVITKRFDLDGNRRFTLEEIGKDFSVTRERIRQVEKNALSKMRRNVFNTSLKHLHEFALSKVTQHGGLLREDILHSEYSSILPQSTKVNLNHLHFSLVLHENLECIGNTVIFHPYVRTKKLADFTLKFASNQLVNQLQKYGDVREAEIIHQDLKVVLTDYGVDKVLLKSLIAIDKRLTLLDNDFVGLLEWRHIHPRTLRDKIMYVLRNEAVPLHFSFIAEKIAAAGFDSRPVNLQAVHNELIRHDSFVLVGRGIYALKEWGYEKGTVSEVVAKILQSEGELAQEAIVERVLKQRQVKKITIILALKNCDKFERVGRKHYKLKKA